MMEWHCEDCGTKIKVDSYPGHAGATKTIMSCLCRTASVMTNLKDQVKPWWGVEVEDLDLGPCRGEECFYQQKFEEAIAEDEDYVSVDRETLEGIAGRLESLTEDVANIISEIDALLDSEDDEDGEEEESEEEE